MKNLILSSVLALSTLAVMSPIQEAKAQDIASLETSVVGDGISWLAKRVYSIEVGTLAYEMEQDGVSSRDYVAVFTMEGAMVQNHEITGSEVGLDKVQRGVGFQILPYKISITSDGRKMVSIGAVSLRNMNMAYKKVASPDSYNQDGTYDAGIWKLINKLDLLVYEYDESISLNNTKVESLVFARAEAKVDLLGASKPGHFLAIVANGSFGFENQDIDRPNGEVLMVKRYERFGGSGTLGFSAKYGVGAEYNLPINSNHKINAKVMLEGGNTSGYPIKKVEGISNQTLKEQANKVERSYMYLRPNLKYDTKLGKKVGMQMSIFGNIPLKDEYNIDNGTSIDLTGINARPIIGAGIKVKF